MNHDSSSHAGDAATPAAATAWARVSNPEKGIAPPTMTFPLTVGSQRNSMSGENRRDTAENLLTSKCFIPTSYSDTLHEIGPPGNRKVHRNV
jgi:hypothetical protein